MFNLIQEELVNKYTPKIPYEDVTQEWLDAIDHSKVGKVTENDFFDFDGIRYDTSNALLDMNFGKNTREAASWLERTFNEDVNLVPRIEKPDGVSTPDFIFRNAKWDLKSPTRNNKQTIYRNVRGKSRQASNFMIDLSKSPMELSEAVKQSADIFKRNDTEFVSTLLLKKDDSFIILKKI